MFAPSKSSPPPIIPHSSPACQSTGQVDKRNYLWYNTTVIGGLPPPKEIFTVKRILILLLTLTVLATACLGSCSTLPEATPPDSITEPDAPHTDPSDKTEDEDCDPSVKTEDEDCDSHTDTDDNGLCDGCGTSVVIILNMFAINDLHGKLCDSASQPGVDELTTYLKNAYRSEEHVLLLSSGDMWQGSAESNLTKGLIVTEWMNELDFVAMTLGNHEYDWGEDFIKQNAAVAEFPFLAINVYDRDTQKRAEYCEPSVLVQYGEASVGIIGAIGDCYSSISGEFSGDVYFKTGKELTTLVKEEATRLRDAGADFIIYSIHDGHSRSSSGTGVISDGQLASYYDPTLSEGYVDIVFEGHTHRSYVLRDGDGVYHLQNGGDNGGISQAKAVINFANGKVDVRQPRFVETAEYQSLSDDPIVNTLMQKYDEQVSLASRVLGNNDMQRSGNQLRQLVADLYLEAGLEAFGEEYPIVLGGGYLSVRSPGYLAAGQVTFSQLQGLFPFENTLVLCSVRGEDLLNKFIHTSNSNYFVSYSDYGSSVKNNIDPNGTYYIIVDTYSSTYAPNRLTEIKRYTAGVYAQHLLADYIEDGGLSRDEQSMVLTPISEALKIGASIPPGQTTEQNYYVRGRVIEIENTTWGNLYIADESGNRIYVYGTYDETGSLRYDAMPNPPKAGDTVLLYGPIMHYANAQTGAAKIEIKDARVIPEQ